MLVCFTAAAFLLAYDSSCGSLGGLTAVRLVLRAQEWVTLPTRHSLLFFWGASKVGQ